jgi:hypothetical protein
VETDVAGCQGDAPGPGGKDQLRREDAAEGLRTRAIDLRTAALDYIAPDLRQLAVPIETLTEAPDNARRHTDRDIQALMDSLRRFGQRKAIVAKARLPRGHEPPFWPATAR